MQQQNKKPQAPTDSSGERKAALQSYEKKHVKAQAQKKEHKSHTFPEHAKKGSAKSAAFTFSHTFTSPLLCAVVYVLILAVGSIGFEGGSTDSRQLYLSLSAVTLFVFMIPSVFYIRFRSLDMRDDLRLRLPTPDKIMFCVLCTLTLILTSVLLSAVGGELGEGIYTQGYGSIKSDMYDREQVLYFAVCFAVVPAVCEELLFRSVIMSELQKSSVLSAVIINSLYFAMLHFDFSNFPFYFFAGLVLSACTYATNSVIASFAVHLGYNLFALFGGGMVRAIVGSIGELTLIIIISAALLLTVLTLALGECQRIYAAYSRKNKDSSYVPEYKRGTGGMRFAGALLSPMSLVCILIFTVSALILK